MYEQLASRRQSNLYITLDNKAVGVEHFNCKYVPVLKLVQYTDMLTLKFFSNETNKTISYSLKF